MMAEPEKLYPSSSITPEDEDVLKEDVFSEAERAVLESTVWRKFDRWVLPFCTIFYLLSFLDRSNIANARVAGLQTSLKMSPYQYTVALTVTYVPYIAAELPSNVLLKHVGPNIMLPAMVTVWGLAATLQGVVSSFSGLLACRFFLGLAEGGLSPALVLYLSFFYPRLRLQIRVATFFASASLSGAFSGLLAAGIDHISSNTGRPGWAWIFILEGIFTFLFGFISFFLLPSSPQKARFLSQEERAYVVSRLKHDGVVALNKESDRFSWTEVVRSTKSLHVLLLSIAMFFNGAMAFGLAYFEPIIVAELGYAGNKAQLMSVPPFATAFVCSMTASFLSDRYGCRGLTTIFFSILEIIGFSMFYAGKSNHVRYASLFFSITGAYSIPPPLLTWVANNSAPQTRRATSVAIAFITTNAGGILSTWLLGTLSPPPAYTKATITFIIMSVLITFFSTVNLIYLVQQNRWKAEQRQKMVREEEPEGLGDRSAWFIYNL